MKFSKKEKNKKVKERAFRQLGFLINLLKRSIVLGPPIDQDNIEWISMPCILRNPGVKTKACPHKEEDYQKQKGKQNKTIKHLKLN